ALEAVMRNPAHDKTKRLPRGTRMAMIMRMAYLLGLLAPSGAKQQSRLRSLLGLVGLGLVLMVGFVLPLVWVPYMAAAMRRSAVAMGARASSFSSEQRSREAGVAVRRPPGVHVPLAAGLTRLLVLIVLPIAVALLALFTGTDMGGKRWLTAGIVFIVVSAAATIGWLGYRRWKRRRRGLT